MSKYYPSQVIFDTPEQRKKAQDFVHTRHGTSFSAYCRFMLLKEMRQEAKKLNATKADA